jgi:hypothetical protein
MIGFSYPGMSSGNGIFVVHDNSALMFFEEGWGQKKTRQSNGQSGIKRPHATC